MSTTTSTTQSAASSSALMRSSSASNATNSPNKEDKASPVKRNQTCFRCRQSKVKCVFEGDAATTCRRCLRLGVNCEMQGKKEPLSWQMRVQHQLAALEGSLQSFLEKQMSANGEVGDKRSNVAGRENGRDREGGGSKKRRRTIANDQRSGEGLTYGSGGSHSHTGESPLYADVNSASASSYPSAAAHLSPRDAERANDASNGLLGSLVATVNAAATTSLPSDHALPDDDAVTTTADRPFSTDDENDQASRPLSAIQKLRMSVLDRKKELSRTGERVFPNLYRLATSDVGSKDPRPNVVKQDLVSPSDAVVLFRFYADYLDQYSFGFPTYRPDAIMSPMILTSVVCVASLHHAQLNRLHMPLKKDLIARLQTDDPSFPCSDVYETLFSSSSSRSTHLQSNLHFEKELDPELGIGVEEIVGASLFASWFGGKRAWMASRLARWWSAKFLRQQQHPAMMTMGEIMSILPPPRDLGKQDLLRVWLSAYITEIHQACMEGTPSIAGLSSPHAVCDSLQYSKGGQRTTQRDRVLIVHSRIAWVLSKAYHVAGNGMEYGKGDKQRMPVSNDSPGRRSCQSCRDGVENGSASGAAGGAAAAAAADAASCLNAVLGAFEELDSCQEEMAGRLDADGIGEAETMLYLDLFLARVLIASIGCDFLDSTLWDGSLGSLSTLGGKTSSEADLQSLRARTLRESLTRGVEGALRSLELVCPTLGAAAGGTGAGESYEASLNVLVLPLWFHWALTRSVLFLMNVLAEYPERLLPRDRSRSIELINMFLDLYSKHIGHANMVLSHASSNGHHRSSHSESAGYAGSSWSPTADQTHGRDHRHSINGATTANGSNGDSHGAAAATTTSNGAAVWQQGSAGGSSQDMFQHPATPLLDTLSQCLTWARHGGVM